MPGTKQLHFYKFAELTVPRTDYYHKMLALELIQFLLKPQQGKIRAMNSPFQQEVFPIKQAETWVRRNKASIVDDVLIFHDDFRLLILKRFQEEEMQTREDQAFETMVDLERSEGERTSGSFAVWAGHHSGKKPYGGVGPENRVMQMKRRFEKP